jgi:tight adherence protein C
MQTSKTLEQRLFADARTRSKISSLRFRGGKPKIDRALLELPQLLDWLSLACANGMSLYQGLVTLSNLAQGEVANQLKFLCRELELGESFDDALANLDKRMSLPCVSEFCNRIRLTLQRGTPVAAQLGSLADSSRARLRNQLLSRAGANEIKLLLPLVFVILPITVWFAVFPSLQLLQAGI